MNKLIQDVHSVAERYLRDLERGHKTTFYAPADNREVSTLADSITERVVIQREEAPQYFVGRKPSGRPVWSHDIKLATSYDSASLTLVNTLQIFKQHGEEVMTMPAAWFSNYHREEKVIGKF